MELPPDAIAYQLAHKDEDIGYQLIATSAIFGALAFSCVVSRFLSRYMSPGPIGIDDYLVVLAMLCGLVLVITAAMLGTTGIGRHLITIKPEEFVKFGKINLALQTSYPFTIGFARLSILALYYRLFSKTSRLFQWVLWACVVYNVLFMIGVLLVVYLQCHPLSSIWTSACAPKFKTTLSTSILNIVGDAMVLLLPQPILWNLKMPVTRKLGISLIMFLGLFTVVISIARIFIIRNGGNQGGTDITYTSTNTFIFTVVEPMTAIICSCLPVMKPVFRWASSTMRGMSLLRSLNRTSDSKSDANLSDSSSQRRMHDEYVRMENMNAEKSHTEVSSFGHESHSSSMNDRGIWVTKQADVDVSHRV